MASSNRHGRPEEELFMQNSSASDRPNSPTVGPLRIKKPQKQQNSSPPNAQDQPPYPESHQRPPYPDHNYGQPSSPPPTAPLPYPDGRNRREQKPDSRVDSPPQASHNYAAPQHHSASRPHFSANDPNRPTMSGYAHTPPPGRASPAPKPLPESPGPETPDKEEDRYGNSYSSTSPPRSGDTSQPSSYQYHYPAPDSGPSELRIPNPGGVNRLASTASVSTTKAARGSPPPPETPAVDYPNPGGIEARYAAAGIAGPSTLSNLQAQSFASQQRQNQYTQPGASQQRPQQSPPQAQRSSPEVRPGPYSQARAQQGQASGQMDNGSNAASRPQGSSAEISRPPRESDLEQDMQRMQVNDEPPPAYSSVSPPTQGYPQEKRPVGVAAAAAAAPAAPANNRPQLSVSPTAANASVHMGQAHLGQPSDQSQPQQIHQPTPQQPGMGSAAQQQLPQLPQHLQHPQQTPSPAPNRTSPPPLPEGWISHLDPSSNQYYYIHLPTQSTQWEFPKGPTPLNLNDQPPLSPTGTIVNNTLTSPAASTFSGKPLASPGMIPGRESVMSAMTNMSSPTAAGFHVPPPSAGVETFKVAPTNGVYFGPYLRYTNMDVENGIWYGSVLIVTDAAAPTIHLHQSQDLSPNPRQLKAHHIYQHQRWYFYRYDIDLRMEDDREAKWTYAITSHLGCTRYEFLVAGRYDTSWRFIAHSGNDFALNVNANERQRVGGVGYMWRDIVQKHVEVGGFHAQLGMGNQIYADRLWKEIPMLRQWTAMSGKDNRKNAPWTARHDEEVTHAYFHYYTSHFDQPHLREAFAQIPHVLTIDDHDIFDGFGSYPEHMQFSNMFKNIGRIGIEMYLLFQHHTTLEILRHVTNDLDLFTITGTGWHFIKYLGPAVTVVGPDCRSERNPYQVMAGPTYQGLFPKIAVLPPHVQHCIWMVPVPVVYPRLDAAEQLYQTMATGKKAVTGTFNALGKVTSSVAGIVGAKGVVGEGFSSVKKAVGKSGLMSSVLSPFGEIEMLDELRDQWTHESKDLERTYLIRTLQGIAHNKSLRMTFFSGSVNCCGAGLLSDPSVSPASNSHKAMFQIISSSVVNAPPSQYVLRMLHPNHASSSQPNNAGGNAGRTDKPLYVPQNGHRSRSDGTPTDTKEDMLEVFSQDVTGHARDTKRLMGRRNYVAVVSFDPEAVSEAFGAQQHGSNPGMGTVEGKDGRMGSSVSLAIDFFVQGDAGQMVNYNNPAGPSAGPPTVKYGPLTIPSVPPGH